jgi:hypothetical protein
MAGFGFASIAAAASAVEGNVPGAFSALAGAAAMVTAVANYCAPVFGAAIGAHVTTADACAGDLCGIQ